MLSRPFLPTTVGEGLLREHFSGRSTLGRDWGNGGTASDPLGKSLELAGEGTLEPCSSGGKWRFSASEPLRGGLSAGRQWRIVLLPAISIDGLDALAVRIRSTASDVVYLANRDRSARQNDELLSRFENNEASPLLCLTKHHPACPTS